MLWQQEARAGGRNLPEARLDQDGNSMPCKIPDDILREAIDIVGRSCDGFKAPAPGAKAVAAKDPTYQSENEDRRFLRACTGYYDPREPTFVGEAQPYVPFNANNYYDLEAHYRPGAAVDKRKREHDQRSTEGRLVKPTNELAAAHAKNAKTWSTWRSGPRTSPGDRVSPEAAATGASPGAAGPSSRSGSTHPAMPRQ